MRRAVMVVAMASALVGARGSIAEQVTEQEIAPDPAAEISRRIGDPVLRQLLEEALARSPELRAREAGVAATTWRADRVGGLPDPEAMLTAYVEPPETRVGPVRLMASVSQRLPWSGKRGLERAAAHHAARAARDDLQAARLAVVVEVRRLYQELAFATAHVGISEDFRRHLQRHEEIARARYATGRGSTQDALKLQAEISRVDQRLLELERRRASLGSRLNGLLDRAPGHELPPATLTAAPQVAIDLGQWLSRAVRRNPRIAGAAARVDGAESEVERAEKSFRPDFMVGLTYALVDRRDDPEGRTSPPTDNGQDDLGIQGGLSIPIWRSQRRAGLEESLESKAASEHARAAVVRSISAELADLAARLELTWSEIRLLEDLLMVQAEEALDSAQAGYVAGTLNALDLFDAEHLLFDTRTAAARSLADYHIALAELEGELGGAWEEATS